MIKEIRLFTNGGSRNHGNINGVHVRKNDSLAWAFRIEYPDGRAIYRSKATKGCTNNQMELQAAIEGLNFLSSDSGFTKDTTNKYKVILYSDSHYILYPFLKKWIKDWVKRGWKTSRGKTIANYPQWRILLNLLSRFKDLHLEWVKGHADSPGNNFVDKLLNEEMDKKNNILT